MSKIKIGNRVSFLFAGEYLEGDVIALYRSGGKEKATISGACEKNYKYPVEVELLKKL